MIRQRGLLTGLAMPCSAIRSSRCSVESNSGVEPRGCETAAWSRAAQLQLPPTPRTSRVVRPQRRLARRPAARPRRWRWRRMLPEVRWWWLRTTRRRTAMLRMIPSPSTGDQLEGSRKRATSRAAQGLRVSPKTYSAREAGPWGCPSRSSSSTGLAAAQPMWRACRRAVAAVSSSSASGS